MLFVTSLGRCLPHISSQMHVKVTQTRSRCSLTKSQPCHDFMQPCVLPSHFKKKSKVSLSAISLLCFYGLVVAVVIMIVGVSFLTGLASSDDSVAKHVLCFLRVNRESVISFCLLFSLVRLFLCFFPFFHHLSLLFGSCCVLVWFG